MNPLLQPLSIGSVEAPNRVMFGPIVTNLGDDHRRFTARHSAFYERRARGGCGVIVTEGASVHESDWPYERAPLASAAEGGWRDIAEACHRHGSVVIASLDHAGGQGSSAYSQRELWAPSRVPEVNAREVPKWMEASDIAAVVAGFANAAASARRAGCDGVEINAGQHSMLRQFMSGLTNHRGDEWADRLRLVTDVIAAVRPAGGAVGLRLCCDELAPWAGITPDMATEIATTLARLVDYLVVVRGSIYSVEKTRPDFHEPPGFNVELCRSIRAAVIGITPVFLQGSVIDPGQAAWALDDGVADGVEMTRAQLADPDLVSLVRRGAAPRPCVLCNQTCQVRDARNPIITCIGEPTTGRETEDPDWYAPAARPRRIAVVGGGVAGLEAARVAALCGHHVTVVERSDRVGGLAAVAGPAAPLVRWLEQQCTELGVDIHCGRSDIERADAIVQATGSVPGHRDYTVDDGSTVVDVAALRRGEAALPDGPIALFDPIGGPIAVALAEELGDRATLITQDNIAGNELSRSGDLAPANTRLQQRGVTILRRSLLRSVRPGEVEVQDRFSGERSAIVAAALVDCGFRLPTSPMPEADVQVGDCVAPRTIHEAVLEARRAVRNI